MRRLLIIAAVSVPALAAAAWGIAYLGTEMEIASLEQTVRATALDATPGRSDGLDGLPAPVKAYLAFAMPDGDPGYRLVRLDAAGDFRRPGSETFGPTEARQTIALRRPALLFAATTPVLPGISARAYDFFADGRMKMRAKIASAITVVDESESDELNRISLRRWLLESPLYPPALLPGGPVRWEAIDDRHARAIVSAFGLESALVAAFGADGSLESFAAETDGDLSTPYHGSGEFVTRGDYRLVQGMMIPHAFEISRAAAGKRYPFWRGNIVRAAFE